MKKVCFIISGLQNSGGIERVATLLANALSDNFEITILSKSSLSNKNAYLLSDKIKDIKIKGNSIYFLLSVKKNIHINNYDLVIIHTMSKLTPLLLLIGLKAKQIWSIEHTSFKAHSLIFVLLRKLIYRRLNRIITLTKNDNEIYKKIFGNKTITIFNPASFGIKSHSVIEFKKIIAIGVLEKHKGFDFLLRSWEKIHDKYPDWSVDIYGTGSEYFSLQRYIVEKGIKNITLKGVTSNIVEVYDSADFLVMTSLYEGLPMVLIEAQSRGLPIVAFDCPSGPSQIVSHDRNGFLLPVGDIDKLTKAIERLIKDDDIRKRFANNAIIDAERFSAEKIFSQWEELISDLC